MKDVMKEKSTDELEMVLGKTHHSDFGKYFKENKEDLLDEQTAFSEYMRNVINEKKMIRQEIFLKADIPERYGYKLLSGEKHTKQRDVILRICYAAGFTLEETQRALKKNKMPALYAKVPRDALIMIIFNERPGSIIDVNELLKKNGMAPLRTSGVQE